VLDSEAIDAASLSVRFAYPKSTRRHPDFVTLHLRAIDHQFFPCQSCDARRPSFSVLGRLFDSLVKTVRIMLALALRKCESAELKITALDFAAHLSSYMWKIAEQ
jgi:hypothetical protein